MMPPLSLLENRVLKKITIKANEKTTGESKNSKNAPRMRPVE